MPNLKLKDAERASAHQAWDRNWQDATERSEWLDAAAEVEGIVPLLQDTGVKRVLDLGCGVGRHSLFLAGKGFEVTALDASRSGLDFARRAADEVGLKIAFQQAQMTDLPFDDGSFDFVLSWNVIYHGDRAVVLRCLEEIARLLRPGGLFQATMLSKRHRLYGQGREVAADTFVIEDGDDHEKAHPHFYCDARGLVDMVDPEFDLLRICDGVASDEPGATHLHLVAERRAGGQP